MEVVLTARQALADVLRDARALLARSEHDFASSGWEGASAALAELDCQIAAVESGPLPPRLALAVLFAPTGPLQEVSISSGWGREFLTLAARYDAAAERVWA